MYDLEFIAIYIITLGLLCTVGINFFRDFIITYRIFVKPKKRDLHRDIVPSSCGILFPIAMLFGIVLISSVGPESTENYNVIFISAFVLSIIGFWDDLKSIAPRTKLLTQFFLIVINLFNSDLVIKNLHGFLGIFEIPYLIGLPFTIFIGVVIINSFNLIDGIDGLAGFLSIVIFSSFGIIFWVLDYPFMFIISLSLTAVILAYLPYNLSEHKKVFMGDSGSLFIGFIIYMMTLFTINNLEPIIDNLFHRSIIPIAPLVIFIYPLIDTASIMFYRFSIGKGVFRPDNLHVHHLLIAFTRSHKISSLIVFVFMILFISLFSYLAFHMDHNYFIITYFITFSLITLFTIASRNRMIKIGLLNV